MTPLSSPGISRRYLRHGTFPQLAAFEAVLRLGSATRAAEMLCMAQPTLSGQLHKLSQALGVRLFQIQGKHLVPTDAALVLLQTAHEVFASFERCEKELAGLRADTSLEAGTANLRQIVPDRQVAAPKSNGHLGSVAHNHGAGLTGHQLTRSSTS